MAANGAETERNYAIYKRSMEIVDHPSMADFYYVNCAFVIWFCVNYTIVS